MYFMVKESSVNLFVPLSKVMNCSTNKKIYQLMDGQLNAEFMLRFVKDFSS